MGCERMDKDRVTIGGTEIEYGVTPVGDLLKAGYTISDFEQILEEPTLATCNLKKKDDVVALLSFYNLKEKMTIGQLKNISIDLALLSRGSKRPKSQGLTPGQALRNRVVLTGLVHLLAAGVFCGIYTLPALFSWVQKGQFRAMGGSAPIGMGLLVLPAVLATFIWGGATGKQKGVAGKLLLALWFVANVALSAGYLVLIDNMFTHRFF